MTREEAIKKLESLKISLPAAKDEISDIIKLIESPWINVKDDLPCNHEEKIHKDYLSTTNVFVLYSDYSLGLNYMRKINNKWIWHNGEPLYWIDMPNYLPTIENEV